MGFLQWWSGWFVILVCSFSILKIPHCPPMFIWETFDQLQHQPEQPARDGRDGCQEAGHANHASPTFYRLSYKLLMYLACLSAWTLSLRWNNVQTHKGALSFHLHSKHTTSSLLPPPSLSPHWFTFPFTASVTFYGDDVHTFFFFYPFAQSRPSWSSQKHGR